MTHDKPQKSEKLLEKLTVGNVRECPECGFKTIAGMPGGRDATCKNCGYKDPCCYD